MELEPEIKVPGLECNRILPEGVLFVNNMVIEELEYVIFFTDVFGDQAFQRWNDIYKLRVKNWKLRFEHSAKSGGLLASISGLLSRRRVTYEYLRSELEGKWNWIDPRAIEVVCLVFDMIGLNCMLASMPSHSHKMFRWGTVFATGCRSFIEPGLGHRMKRTNRRTQVPIDLYPCHIKKKMIMKKVRGESIMEWKIKVTTKEGTVIKFPGKFRGIKLAT
ncbi:hypothetical protein Tco_0441088 [Tanacetum coccineum]